MKRKYNLVTLPKYASSDELLLWSDVELANLYKQCQRGRTCYLDNYHGFEAYYEAGYFTEKMKRQIVVEAIDTLDAIKKLDIRAKIYFHKGPTGDYKGEQTITTIFFDSPNLDETVKLELGNHWYNIALGTSIDSDCGADQFSDKQKVILRIAYKVLEKYREHEYPF